MGGIGTSGGGKAVGAQGAPQQAMSLVDLIVSNMPAQGAPTGSASGTTPSGAVSQPSTPPPALAQQVGPSGTMGGGKGQ